MKYGTDRAASPEAHTIETSRNPSRAVHRFRGSRLRLVQASVSGKFGRTHLEQKLSAMLKSYANYHVSDVILKAVFVRGCTWVAAQMVQALRNHVRYVLARTVKLAMRYQKAIPRSEAQHILSASSTAPTNLIQVLQRDRRRRQSNRKNRSVPF